MKTNQPIVTAMTSATKDDSNDNRYNNEKVQQHNNYDNDDDDKGFLDDSERKIMMADPIIFPSSQKSQQQTQQRNEREDNITVTTTHAEETDLKSFQEVCALAVESRRPIELQNDVILEETITLKRRQHLIIRSRCQSPCLENDDDNNDISSSTGNLKSPRRNNKERISISGNIHSLFLLNNSSRLTVQNIDFHHIITSNDHKQVGAAINLRYKSQINLQGCRITSHAGFGCWSVQKSSMRIENCDFYAPLRSCIVCFGQTKLLVTQSKFEKAGVHAICARGLCELTIKNNCHFTKNAARAIYAYGGASVIIQNCYVASTIHPLKAAIEISSSASGEGGHNTKTPDKAAKPPKSNTATTSRLSVTNCTIVDNGGAGICVRGPTATFEMTGENNTIERNTGGNIIILHKSITEDGDDNDDTITTATDKKEQHQQNEKDSAVPIPRRDIPGTSFRQGDWWCPKCPMYSVSQNKCSECHFPKTPQQLGQQDQDGNIIACPGVKYLTVEEINLLNQGKNPFITNDTRNINTIDVPESSAKLGARGHLSAASKYCWSYDADDKGWIKYDDISQRLLEDTYQRYCNHESDIFDDRKDRQEYDEANGTINPKTVLLSDGKYQVNVATMEQINVQSHFMRLVRRRRRM